MTDSLKVTRGARSQVSSAPRRSLLALAALAAAAAGPEARAADTPAPTSSAEAPAEDNAPASVAPLLGPVGDWGGLRPKLASSGIELGVNYIGEVWGNTSGGLNTGGAYNGRFQFSLDADLNKFVHWEGATFHASALQIQGSGFSGEFLGNIMGVSNIDALSATRLFEIYLEQSFADGKASVRIGQLSADSEFATSDNASLFLNSTFGWPALFAADLPSGGPAYPLATPGVRLKLAPTDNLSTMVGLFNGNPSPCCGDPQVENRNGVNFLLNDGFFVIGEAAYSYGKDIANWLPGTVKLGMWYNSNAFPDQRLDASGLPLASPLSTGAPMQISGDYAVYGIVDQLIYRKPETKDQGIGFFGRLTAAPDAQNEMSLYADVGLNFKGMVPYRDDDSFGIAVGLTRVSSAARGFDRDVALYSGSYYPVRSSEAVLEITYSAQIVPGWTVQPDFQYIWNPGAGAPNPNDPTGGNTIKNAAVFGVRTTINF